MPRKPMPIGGRFGRLVVLKNEAFGLCVALCDCGVRKLMMATALRTGAAKSCGCQIGRKPRHGHLCGYQQSSEYGIWVGMIQRCTNPNNQSWKYYGGRGIAVWAAWRADFAAFLRDVGRRPSPELSLDRIDNDGNYEPGNVRWATRQQQQANTRRSRRSGT